MYSRLLVALKTFPHREDWLLGFVFLLLYSVVALIWGFKRNFFKFQLLRSPLKISQIILTSFFTPAFVEEIFFRVFLLPQPTQTLEKLPWIIVIINISIFVIYHPLNAMTFFPRGRKIFFEDTFLSLAALLGTICIIVYWESGSIWLSVIVHWIIVITWLVCLEGYDLLYKIDTNNEKKV